MVIVIKRPAPKRRGNRGRNFDETAKAIAPEIIALWDKGVRTTRGLAKALNDAGVPAPGGKSFDYSKVRRVLRRMQELGLGPGPQSPRAAANHRVDEAIRRWKVKLSPEALAKHEQHALDL